MDGRRVVGANDIVVIEVFFPFLSNGAAGNCE